MILSRSWIGVSPKMHSQEMPRSRSASRIILQCSIPQPKNSQPFRSAPCLTISSATAATVAGSVADASNWLGMNSPNTTVAYRPFTALTYYILWLSSALSTKCAVLIHYATVVLGRHNLWSHDAHSIAHRTRTRLRPAQPRTDPGGRAVLPRRPVARSGVQGSLDEPRFGRLFPRPAGGRHGLPARGAAARSEQAGLAQQPGHDPLQPRPS